MLVDSKGVVYKGRKEGMNKYKERFLVETDARTLADAVKGADVFYGLSVANVLTPEMVKSMAKDPIVMAMAAGSLVEAADRALYRAKRAGRNRTELCTSEELVLAPWLAGDGAMEEKHQASEP